MSTCPEASCLAEMVTGHYREPGKAADRRRWLTTPWTWCPYGHGPEEHEPFGEECPELDHTWRPVNLRLTYDEDPKRPYVQLGGGQRKWLVCLDCGEVRYG